MVGWVGQTKKQHIFLDFAPLPQLTVICSQFLALIPRGVSDIKVIANLVYIQSLNSLWSLNAALFGSFHTPHHMMISYHIIYCAQ